MNRSTFRNLATAALIVAASPLLAQSNRGAINGTVLDPSGAVIPNASVTAIDVDTNSSYHVVSTSAGEFTFPNLPLGNYVVTVQTGGFATAKYEKIQVEAGSPYTLEARLSASSSGETVEVNAASIALDTVTDIQATTLPEVEVQNIPNSGRDFTQLLSQTTGFAGYSTGGGAGTASINGTRSNDVNWQIEGTDNNDLWWNIPAVNQGGVSAIAGVILPIDAIDNFSFVSSGTVALGRNPGGTANLVLKSGTNSLHGSAYYFNHNEFFEAKNPFSSGRKPKSRLQDYGFSVGGPILRNKFFFFLSGEHQNFLLGAESKATEPTLAYQADAYKLLDFYGIPHNAVASNLVNGNGTLPGLWPSAVINCPSGGTSDSGQPCDSPDEYTASGNLTGHSFNGLIKLSAKLTDKDTLSASWFVAQGTQTAPTSSALTPYFENAPIHVENYSVIYNRLLSNSLANQLSAGVSYFNQVFSDADTGFSPIGLGLNTGVSDPSLAGAPHIVIGPTGSGVGLTAGNSGFDPTGVTAPSGRNDITGHVDEDLSWTKGKHQMRFGGEFRHAQVDDFYQTGQRGTLTFDGSQGPWSGATATPCALQATKNIGVASPAGPANLADFLAGCADPTSSSIVLGDPKRFVYLTTGATYAQDAWQLSKRFSFNYGLRWDYEGPVHSAHDDLSIFAPTQPSGLAVAGQQVASIYPKYYGAYSPRIGFAWQVDNTGSTVLRGGYGYYYDTIYMKEILQNNGAQNISVFGPGLNPAGSALVANASVNNAVIQPGVDVFPTLAAATTGVPAPGSIKLSTFDPRFRPSSTQLFDLNLEHSVTSNLIWQIGYVGSKGSHLAGLFDINPESRGAAYIPCPPANVNPDGSCSVNTAQQTRPYNAQFPQFGVIDELRSNLGSIYHSLQTNLRLQNYHGLTGQVNYTWSHALDYETGLLPYLPQDPTNERGEYGNSDFDVRNTFVADLDYALPAFYGPKRLTRGWELNGAFSIHGGTPYTVVASSNVSGNGEGADRAVQTTVNPNAVNHAITGGTVQWFSPTAFADPANGTYSPTRRGQNYNPAYRDVDLSVIKTTPIAERVNFQFRANLYNLFNHTNLAPVGFAFTGDGDGTGTPTSGSGVIGSTIGPFLGNPSIGPGEPFNVELSGKIIF